MSVLEDYVPFVSEPRPNSLTYAFVYPFIDTASIEVYESLDTGLRSRVRQDDYFIRVPRMNLRGSNPTKSNGAVVFTRPHADNVNQIIVERNTFMDQTVDFRQFSPFNTRLIEYTLDKLTLIAQEINERKCASGISIPIQQPLVFGSYRKIPAFEVNAALDRITRILFEIDAKTTDCRTGNAPEGRSVGLAPIPDPEPGPTLTLGGAPQ